MTILQALQSIVEYQNDNLLTKAITDNGLSATATYTSANAQSVDMAAADIYLILLNHPSFREGSKYIEYKPGALLALRNTLLAKWGVTPTTISVPMDLRYNKSW